MSINRLIGEMKNGQQMFQCIVCKTVWSQYTDSAILIQRPECIPEQKIEYKEELIDDMFKKSLPVQIPIQCPECKSKIDDCQPKSSEECCEIECEKCVFNKYTPEVSPCPFQLLLSDNPAINIIFPGKCAVDEPKPKIDGVNEKQNAMQGILFRITKEKLQRPATFLQKIDLGLVNWNSVSTEKITKIYNILVEPE